MKFSLWNIIVSVNFFVLNLIKILTINIKEGERYGREQKNNI